MSESLWNPVSSLEDGQDVNASTFNKPISQLVGRTDYLKNAVDDLRGSGPFTAVVITAVLSSKDTPVPGDIVAFDPLTRTYVKALASMDLFDAFRAAPSSYAVGFLKSVSGNMGSIVAFGRVDLSDDFQDLSRLVQKDEPFSPGLFYISATEPGKITSYPSGPRIQIGTFSSNPQTGNGDFALIDPQYTGITDHIHRSYVLSARPVGEVERVGDVERVTGYKPDSGNPDLPRLVVSGEWHTSEEPVYTVWLSSSGCDEEGSFGTAPTTFDSVYVNWSSSDPEEPSGSVPLHGYFQEVGIGDHGVVVSLEPGGSDLYNLYTTDVGESDRTWTLDMPFAAKGWRQNLFLANDSFLGLVKQGGSISDSYSLAYSMFGYDLTSYLDELANEDKGGYIVVGNTVFVFHHVTEDGELVPVGGVPEGKTVVDITVAADGFETGRKIGGVVDGEDAHVVLNERKDVRSVTLFCDGSVSVDGNDIQPTLTGGMVSSFDDHGYSLFGESFYYGTDKNVLFTVDGGSYYVCDDLSEYRVSEFENGLHAEGAYRYNMGIEEDLNLFFPPVPRKSGSLMLNGVELESDELYDKKGIYSIGPDTIYWMDDHYGYGPWGSYIDPDQETDNEPRLTFHFVTSFHSTTGPVTSLRPADGSPITVRQCGTTENATVGDLEVGLDLALDVADASLPGYNAVKGARNSRLLLGPVVEKINAGPGIAITQKKGHPNGQGVVTVSLSDYAYNGHAETIALENAKQEMIGMFPYVKLLGYTTQQASIPSGFITKFTIPTSVLPGTYRIRMYMTVFGEESYENSSSLQYAGVSFDYNVLPDFNTVSGTGIPDYSLNLKSDLISPDSSTVVSIPLGQSYVSETGIRRFKYDSFDPVLIHNDVDIGSSALKAYEVLPDPFPNNDDCSQYFSTHTVSSGELGVKPGYSVAVRLSRSAPRIGASPYVGKLGFLSVRWALEEV